MYKCEIIKDSISEEGKRLTTYLITFPRFILAEHNTHRVFSRNLSSSRAIPTNKLLQNLIDDPVLPIFCRNRKGMSSDEILSGEDLAKAQKISLEIRDFAIEKVKELTDPNGLNIHKQVANRYLEPWMWATAITSATEWDNFFALRCHPDAQPEFQVIAEMMLSKYLTSTPTLVKQGQWHIPFEREEDEEYPIETRIRAAIGRIARVSYLTYDGNRDISKDLELFDRLCTNYPLHASPSEHVARPSMGESNSNFKGWLQYRKLLPNENITDFKSVLGNSRLQEILDKYK